MEIMDKDIDDSYYYNILYYYQKARGIVPFTFIDCDFVGHLGNVSFRHCTFTNCTFRYESFRYINFYDCDFSNIIFKDDPRTCMHCCNLDNCNLDESFKQSFEETSPLPKTGSFIAWKKAIIPLLDDTLKDYMDRVYGTGLMDYAFRYTTPCIIKLLIPEDAKRSCAFSNKCRCDKAKVLDIQDLSGKSLCDTIAYSQFDPMFKYTIGKTVTPREPFDTNPFNACSSGIHFFMSREEAANYN